MILMKMTRSFAKLLKILTNGDRLERSKFKDRSDELLQIFIDDGILHVESIGTQHKKVYCRNVAGLETYLQHKFQINNLRLYVETMDSKDCSRADLVRAGGDSKLKKKKVFHGFLVNTYHDIKGKLNGCEMDLCPPHGCFTFINDFKTFIIPPEVTVVVVENFDNFRLLEGQKHLFNNILPLFVWRFRNSIDIANWLNLIPNNYLHYGDFDPKGLHIYISEFRSKIPVGRSDFFIPDGIEELLSEYGKKKRYEDQVDWLKNIDFESVPEIADLYRTIKKLKEG